MNRVIFTLLAAAFLVAVILLASFLGISTKPSNTFQIKPNESTILLGITPWGDPVKVKKSYMPLVNYLSQKLGKKIQFLSMEDYDVAADNIVEGNIDIAVLAPVSYVKAVSKEPKLQYIATTLMSSGNRVYSTYKGILIARKDRYPGWKLHDFFKNSKNYRMGFVSQSSASGYAYPLAMLRKMGVDPFKSFKSVDYFGNHPATIAAVAEGKVDIGATWDGSLEDAEKKYGKIFEVIYETPDIPGSSWIASTRVDKKLVDTVRTILFEINDSKELEEELLKSAPDKGWTITDDSFYDSVREVMRYVSDFK